LDTNLERQLERLFHTSHTHGWNGPEVVRQAIAARDDEIPDSTKDALATFAADLTEVERAAWTTCMRFALETDHLEAKLAATAQAADEANHFQAIKEYSLRLGATGAQVDFGLSELLSAAASAPLSEVLVMMQLTVENAADHLFRQISRSNADVVISKLFPYYARDERRHVAFAELYLQSILPSPDDEIGIAKVAMRWRAALSVTLRWLAAREETYARLGVDVAEIAARLREDLQSLEESGPTLRVLVPAVLTAIPETV